MPPQDGLDAIDCSANKDKYDNTEDSITFSQYHLNDLIRDLCLSKKKAELLASNLKQKNVFEKDVKVICYRKRNRDFSSTFKFEETFCYCHNIEELF